MKKGKVIIKNVYVYSSEDNKFIPIGKFTLKEYADGKVKDKYIDIGIEGTEIFYYKDTSLEVDDLCNEAEVYLKYNKNSSVYLIKLPFNEDMKIEAYPEGLETDDIIIADEENIFLYIEVPNEIPILYKIRYSFISEDRINGVDYEENFYIEIRMNRNSLSINKLEKGNYILDKKRNFCYNKLKIRN